MFCPKFKSPCFDMKVNYGPDGSAIFYRKNVFQIQNLSCDKIPSWSLDDDDSKDDQPPAFDSQMILIAELKHISSGRHVTIVSIHLKSKASNHAKRARQIKHVLKEVSMHVMASLKSTDIGKHAVIMCGDFNGEPFENFYKSIVDMPGFGFKDAYSNLASGEGKLPTSIKFRGNPAEMLTRAIDYVFYRPLALELTEYLELPVDDPIIKEQGLPNLTYSSDHLALACGFRFLA